MRKLWGWLPRSVNVLRPLNFTLKNSQNGKCHYIYFPTIKKKKEIGWKMKSPSGKDPARSCSSESSPRAVASWLWALLAPHLHAAAGNSILATLTLLAVLSLPPWVQRVCDSIKIPTLWKNTCGMVSRVPTSCNQNKACRTLEPAPASCTPTHEGESYRL